MINVLVIDADPDFRTLLDSFLTERGMRVHAVPDGREGDAVLSEQAIDAVVVEAGSGEVTGLRWIERLRTYNRAIRVVMVSTSLRHEPGLRHVFARLDVSSIVFKPINASHFADWLLRLLSNEAPGGAPNAGPRPLELSTGIYGALSEIRQQFSASLPNKLTELEHAVATARMDRTHVDRALMLAHRLRGSAGSYGREAVSAAAGHLEDLLLELQSDPSVGLRRNFWNDSDNALNDLRLALSHTPIPPTVDVPGLQTKVLLVVDADPEFLRVTRVVGRKLLVEVIGAQSGQEALQRAQVQPLLGAIVDIQLPGEDAFALAKQLRATRDNSEVPIAFASYVQTVEVLKASVEAGGSSVYDKAGSEEELSALIQQLSTLTAEQQGQVLIVDDDPDIVTHYTYHLRATGLAVNAHGSAEGLLERLEELRPDVLILDLGLPGISGLEVCSALRMSARWQLLPILIVTSRVDSGTRLAAFRAGASDVITKPVLPAELLARVGVQLARVRLVRERAEKDMLSGVLLRRAFVESLQRATSQCARRKEPLALVLIDLDHFKRINDQHGHVVGDQVLARFGSLLRQRFRVEDLRGRWGGEEFVLAFPGADAAFAERAAAMLLADLSQIQFRSESGESFGATFTAGIACYPEDGVTLSALVRRADELLYRGKRAGRNRICRPRAATATSSTSLRPERPMRVLLVDDEEDIRRIGKVSLEKVGKLATTTAASAREAIECATRDPPDLILMDMMMPGMDGLAALAEIRNTPALSRIPVIFMTAKVQRSEIARYLKAGAAGVIQKPFDPIRLPSDILQLLSTVTDSSGAHELGPDAGVPTKT